MRKIRCGVRSMADRCDRGKITWWALIGVLICTAILWHQWPSGKGPDDEEDTPRVSQRRERVDRQQRPHEGNRQPVVMPLQDGQDEPSGPTEPFEEADEILDEEGLPVLLGSVIRPDGSPIVQAEISVGVGAAPKYTTQLERLKERLRTIGDEADRAGVRVPEDQLERISKQIEKVEVRQRGEGGPYRSRTLFTDVSGAFKIEGMGAGLYRVRVYTPRGRKASADLLLERGTRKFRIVVGDEANMRVQVVDEENRPLPGAQINGARVQSEYQWHGRFDPLAQTDFGAMTDGAGEAVFRSLPADGRFVVCAHHPDFVSTCERMELKDQAYGRIRIKLAKGIRVFGTVADEGGSPVTDADVIAAGSVRSPQMRGRALTGPDGGYELHLPREETYHSVFASKGGARSEAVRVSQKIVEPEGDSPEAEINLVLAPRGVVRVTVLDEVDEKPIRAAAVELVSANRSNYYFTGVEQLAGENTGAYGNRAMTDGEGVAFVTGLEPGSYTALAAAQDMISGLSDPLEVTVDNEVSVTVYLREGLSIFGRVEEADGSPIARAQVTTSYRTDRGDDRHGGGGSGEEGGRSSHQKSAWTDEQGRFSLSGLSPMEVELQARIEGGSHEEFQPVFVDLTDGEDEQGVVIKREPGFLIEGRVTDSDGNPLSGRIKVEPFLSAQIAEDGRYKLFMLEDPLSTIPAQMRERVAEFADVVPPEIGAILAGGGRPTAMFFKLDLKDGRVLQEKRAIPPNAMRVRIDFTLDTENIGGRFKLELSEKLQAFMGSMSDGMKAAEGLPKEEAGRSVTLPGVPLTLRMEHESGTVLVQEIFTGRTRLASTPRLAKGRYLLKLEPLIRLEGARSIYWEQTIYLEDEDIEVFIDPPSLPDQQELWEMWQQLYKMFKVFEEAEQARKERGR